MQQQSIPLVSRKITELNKRVKCRVSIAKNTRSKKAFKDRAFLRSNSIAFEENLYQATNRLI